MIKKMKWSLTEPIHSRSTNNRYTDIGPSNYFSRHPVAARMRVIAWYRRHSFNEKFRSTQSLNVSDLKAYTIYHVQIFFLSNYVG